MVAFLVLPVRLLQAGTQVPERVADGIESRSRARGLGAAVSGGGGGRGHLFY